MRSSSPRCGGAVRVIALIQEPAVIDKILQYLRENGRDARAGPCATGPLEGGAGASGCEGRARAGRL